MANPVMHFEIIGKDAIALQSFYADVFGWKLGPPSSEMGNYSLVDNEGKGIGGGIGEGEPRVSVYIEVDDPRAYLNRAVERGATVLMPVTRIMENLSIGMLADPAGNAVGVMSSR